MVDVVRDARRAGLGRLLDAIGPDRVAHGEMPLRARPLLYLIEDGSLFEGERGARWLGVLTAYLLRRGLAAECLSGSRSDLLTACAAASEVGRTDIEHWVWLRKELEGI